MTLSIPTLSDATREQHARKGWLLSLAGSLLLIVSGLLSWSFDDRILGDISIRFYPASVQLFVMVVGTVALLLVLIHRGLFGLDRWIDTTLGLRALSVWSVLLVAVALLAIAFEAGGILNANEGAWIALAGGLLLVAGSQYLPQRQLENLRSPRAVLPAFVEILTIAVLMAVVLFVAAYALNNRDGWIFVLLLLAIGTVLAGLVRAGFFEWFSAVGQRHRHVLTLAAFAVAFLFPFTQKGSDSNMSIASGVLIFAVTAIGLNIVVGLAGLLDLGYIAFLGAGAYVGAILSAYIFATVNWTPPFLVVMLIGGTVAAILGLIVGSPTLRVSGDYLAIVTLAFGEIFRLAMFNLDGTNGPNLTRGPNGISAIPDLNFFGFNFGEPHELFGITLGRYSNYYFLLLVLAAFVILVFSRLNDSRIGRGWVAIREDERAAEAMGVNTFGLKLFAFAGGAFLAGLAGTIKAHQDVSISPDQFIFLESAFLLSAVVLGGMGTVAGVLIGAALIKRMPEKLRFISEYRLLIFGLILVLMMRFRPEGLVASRRRQLEFHEDDEELAEVAESEILDADNVEAAR